MYLDEDAEPHVSGKANQEISPPRSLDDLLRHKSWRHGGKEETHIEAFEQAGRDMTGTHTRRVNARHTQLRELGAEALVQAPCSKLGRVVVDHAR